MSKPVSPGKDFSTLPIPLLQQCGSYLETRDLINVFARGSKKLSKALLESGNSSSALLRGCASREYPLLSRDITFLSEQAKQEYPNLSEDQRTHGRHLVRLCWTIDSRMKKGIFMTKTYDSRMKNISFDQQRFAFHGSRMFIARGFYIEMRDIRNHGETQNIELTSLEDGTVTRPQLPWTEVTCRGNAAITANDKFIAVNILDRENPLKIRKSYVQIYSIETRKLVTTVPFEPAVSVLRFDSNGDLITGDREGNVKKTSFASKSSDSTTSTYLEKPVQRTIVEGTSPDVEITALHTTEPEIIIGEATGNIVRYNCASNTSSRSNICKESIDKISTKPSGDLLVLTGWNNHLYFNSDKEPLKGLQAGMEPRSDRSFSLSDKMMFTLVQGRLHVSPPFDFSVNENSLMNAPKVNSENNILLHCDGARLVLLTSYGNDHPYIKVLDFSMSPEQIKSSYKERLPEGRASTGNIGHSTYLDRNAFLVRLAAFEAVKEKVDNKSAENSGSSKKTEGGFSLQKLAKSLINFVWKAQ